MVVEYGARDALRLSLVVFDEPSFRLGLPNDLQREAIRVDRIDAVEIGDGADGPVTPVTLVWLPANAPEPALTDLVSWAARAGRPAALLGCAPDGDVRDSERALAAGFDDFVAGRVSSRELAGRVRALSRRLHFASTQQQARLRYGTVTVDRTQHQLWIGGERIPVTRTELAVMTALVAARGQARSRAEILDAAWGDQNLDVGERAVDNVILRLRRKIGDPDLIVTVRGVGFRLAESS